MEDHAMILIMCLAGIPTVIGCIIAFLTRPRKTYYRFEDGVWMEKR